MVSTVRLTDICTFQFCMLMSVDHLNSPLVNLNNKTIIKVLKKSTDILKWVRGRAKGELIVYGKLRI